jgi:hypothetical protein
MHLMLLWGVCLAKKMIKRLITLFISLIDSLLQLRKIILPLKGKL